LKSSAATFVGIPSTGAFSPPIRRPWELIEVSSFPQLEKTRMKTLQIRSAALRAALFTSLFCLQPAAHAQGCVAAHSPQPIISGLDPTSATAIVHSAGTNFLHGLTITTGYRVYNSYKHYIGTVYQVQRQINHNAVVNHVNLFELDLNYQITPRLSAIATVPALEATGTARAVRRISIVRAASAM
jgi:hypothetical protein